MKQQSIESQRGEIEFRKKLVQQQAEGKRVFNDELDAEGIEKILYERINKTLEQMILLKKSGVVLSPYIEIGAERCQRSLVMENDLAAEGAAIDISFDMLKSCDYYKEVFNRNKVPLRICCDANDLPFMSNSIPFVFCYETLHHFPDPTPIIEEIHRVLSPGGHFFFDEEPYKKVLHLNLYKGKKVYSKEYLTRSTIKKIFDYFFSKVSCNEVEHGIIENHDIAVSVWKRSLSVFDDKDIALKSISHINCELVNPKHYIKFLFAYLFGGIILGTCQKSGILKTRDSSIYDSIICPSCLKHGRELKLVKKNFSFFCNACNNHYPIIDGIVFLFSYDKFEELYPELLKKIQQIKNDIS